MRDLGSKIGAFFVIFRRVSFCKIYKNHMSNISRFKTESKWLGFQYFQVQNWWSPLIDIIFPGSKLIITVNWYKNNSFNWTYFLIKFPYTMPVWGLCYWDLVLRCLSSDEQVPGFWGHAHPKEVLSIVWVYPPIVWASFKTVFYKKTGKLTNPEKSDFCQIWHLGGCLLYTSPSPRDA